MVHFNGLMVMVLNFELAGLVEFVVGAEGDDLGFGGEFHFVI